MEGEAGDGRLKAGRLGWFIGGRRRLWVKSVRNGTEEQTYWLNTEFSEAVTARFESSFVPGPTEFQWTLHAQVFAKSVTRVI